MDTLRESKTLKILSVLLSIAIIVGAVLLLAGSKDIGEILFFGGVALRLALRLLGVGRHWG